MIMKIGNNYIERDYTKTRINVIRSNFVRNFWPVNFSFESQCPSTVIRINSSFDSDGWTAGSCRKLATAAVVFIGDRSINIYIWRPISEISERPETLHVLLDNCLETIKQLPVHYFTISRFENLGRVFWKKKKKN